MVGNDVVDLGYFDQPGYGHILFLDRVCTATEAARIRKSVEPARSLAVLWSAKEAAYKLIAKQRAHVRFVPRQFVTGSDEDLELNHHSRLIVTHVGMRAMVDIFANHRWVHAVATFTGKRAIRWTVCEIDRYSPHGEESGAVRSLAAHLLSSCGGADLVLGFDGRVPMVLGKGGRRTGVGISLSHHGAFAAVAITGTVRAAKGAASIKISSANGFSLEEMCSTCTA